MGREILAVWVFGSGATGEMAAEGAGAIPEGGFGSVAMVAAGVGAEGTAGAEPGGLGMAGTPGAEGGLGIDGMTPGAEGGLGIPPEGAGMDGGFGIDGIVGGFGSGAAGMPDGGLGSGAAGFNPEGGGGIGRLLGGAGVETVAWGAAGEGGDPSLASRLMRTVSFLGSDIREIWWLNCAEQSQIKTRVSIFTKPGRSRPSAP